MVDCEKLKVGDVVLLADYAEGIPEYTRVRKVVVLAVRPATCRRRVVFTCDPTTPHRYTVEPEALFPPDQEREAYRQLGEHALEDARELMHVSGEWTDRAEYWLRGLPFPDRTPVEEVTDGEPGPAQTG